MEKVATDVLHRLHAGLQLEGEDRDVKMHALYEDVCSPIDECALPSLDPEAKQCALYYQALSLFFERDPSGTLMAGELLPIFTEMWDCADVRATFTLVMHRWIFAQDMDICKALNVLAKGANTLFWEDMYTMQEANKTVDGNVYVLLVKLTSRFICYYELHSDVNTDGHTELQDLSCFILRMESSAWWKRCVGTDIEASCAASIVVTEIVHQLENIRSEELIAQYLLRMRSLEAVVKPGQLEIHARLRLENILHGLSAPGGPLYPPRGIRARARRVLDGLFPTGRHSRKVVHLSFRLLNPYRWPTSLAHWTLIQSVSQVPMNVWTWVVEHAPPSVVAVTSGAAARWKSIVNVLLGRRAVSQ